LLPNFLLGSGRKNKKEREKIMEKLFKLKANGTTVRTEILAGLTTFMTMAYIYALNPNLLTNFAVGTPLWNGVFLATCIASAIGTICMAFFVHKPFVMRPADGRQQLFAVVVANNRGRSTEVRVRVRVPTAAARHHPSSRVVVFLHPPRS